MTEHSIAWLVQAVERFGRTIVAAPDHALDRAWAWDDYDNEGIRFATFVTYTELQDLAVRCAAARIQEQREYSLVQRIVAQYHAAWRDLEALLEGQNDELCETRPAPESWSVRETFRHMIETDAVFYAVIRYGYERAQEHLPPEKVPERYYDDVLGSEEAFSEAMSRPVSDMRRFYGQHHARVLNEFAVIPDAFIETPLYFWERATYPLRFRLLRFDAHLRQHTIQVEKTLLTLGHPPGEAQRIVRLLYRALAEVEGALLGAPDLLPDACTSVAASIASRTNEIGALLA